MGNSTASEQIRSASLPSGGVPLDAVRQLQQERDHLLLLHEAIGEVERASSIDERLRVFVEAIRRIGFGRAAITLRDAELNAIKSVTSGLSKEDDDALQERPVPGSEWARRFPQLERFRVSNSWYLNGRDPWVIAEFGDVVPSSLPASTSTADWSPRDSLVVPLRNAGGQIVATLVVDDPEDRQRPTLTRIRTVELFAQQVSSMLEHASLMDIARQRSIRLQQLHQTGSLLARSLDESTILRALARQVEAMLPVRRVVVLAADDAGVMWPRALRYDNVEHDEIFTPAPLKALGALAARNQRPVRQGEALAVPAVVGPTTMATIIVEADNVSGLPPGDVDLLLTMAAQAGSAISNARLYAESLRQRGQTEALADVARAVGESLDLDDVLQLILRHAAAQLRTEGASIALVRGDNLEVTAAIGVGKALVGTRLPMHGSMAGRAVRSASSIIADDVHTDPDTFGLGTAAAAIQNTVIVPLLSAQGPVGALSVFNRDAPFAIRDAEILQRLADHVAVAVVNARLFGEVAEATREWAVAFDSIGSGMVLLDRRGRIQRTNARARGFLNASTEDELLGKELHTALFGDAEPCDDCIHFAAIKSGQVRRGTHADHARERVFDITAAPHPLGGAVVTFDDITHYRSLAERHRRVLETTREAIVITDRDRRIAFANPAAHELLGRGTELIGLPTARAVPSEFRSLVREREELAFAGEPQTYEGSVMRPDGEIRTVAINTAPLTELGEVSGVVASMRDVTDERRLTQQLFQQEKLVAIGQLVSGVAHELNNPLAGVMAFAQLLLASPTPMSAEQRQSIETIHREAKRASKIVSSLLTFARQQPAERSATRINDIICDTIELRRYALRSEQVELVLSLDPTLPETWADPSQLQQVFLNLITNAEQALAVRGTARRIHLKTSCSATHIMISVSDNGPGIPAHQLDRIFNPFFTTKTVGQGTGLGLSISDGIVREHSGRILVESKTGEGAAFIVELPIDVPPRSGEPARTTPAFQQVVKASILVVDDEHAMRAAVSGFLRSIGHEVQCASNTKDARALLRETDYDVVLLDLRMPHEGGEAFFRDLQIHDSRIAQKVVFITGDLQSNDAQKFLISAGRPVIGKPFELDDLASIIANAVG